MELKRKNLIHQNKKKLVEHIAIFMSTSFCLKCIFFQNHPGFIASISAKDVPGVNNWRGSPSFEEVRVFVSVLIKWF